MEDKLQLAIEVITKNADSIAKVSEQVKQLGENTKNTKAALQQLNKKSEKAVDALVQFHSSVRNSNSAVATFQRSVGSAQKHVADFRDSTKDAITVISGLSKISNKLSARFEKLIDKISAAGDVLKDFKKDAKAAKDWLSKLAKIAEKAFGNLTAFSERLEKASKAVSEFTKQIRRGSSTLERQKELTIKSELALRKFKDRMNEVKMSTKGATRSLLGFIGRCIKFTVIFTSVYETIQLATQAIKEFIISGARFNETIDTARIGIAALVAANSDFVDAFGRTISETDQFRVAMSGVDSQIAILRKGAIETSATLEDLVTAYQMAVGYGLSAGMSLEQIADVTVRITQAAEALHMPFHAVYEEIRSILAGTITQHSLIAKMLGLSNALVNQWKEQGTLYKELTARLGAFVAAGKEIQNTWTGILSRVQDVSSLFMGLATSTIWDDLKSRIKDALSELYDFKADKFAPELRGLAMLIHDTFYTLSKWGKDIFSNLKTLLIDLSVTYEQHRNLVLSILSVIDKAWVKLNNDVSIANNVVGMLTDGFSQLSAIVGGGVIYVFSALLKLLAKLAKKIPFLGGIADALREVADEGFKYVNFYVNQFNTAAKDFYARWSAIKEIALGTGSALSGLSEDVMRFRGELASLSIQLGVNVDSLEKLNFLVQNGVVLWNDATGHYQVAAINFDVLSQKLGLVVDSYGSLINELNNGTVVWDASINQYTTASEFLQKIEQQIGLTMEKYSTFQQLLTSGVIIWDEQAKKYTLNAEALESIAIEIGKSYNSYDELLNAIDTGRVAWDANKQVWIDTGNIMRDLSGDISVASHSFTRFSTESSKAADAVKTASKAFSEAHKILADTLKAQISSIDEMYNRMKSASQDPDIKAVLDLATQQAQAITSYFNRATAAVNKYFKSAKGNEIQLLKARKEIYTTTYNEYKRLIDRLISEEERRRKKASEIEDYIKNLRRDTSEWVRELRRKDMSELDAYYDRVSEIEETIAEARKVAAEQGFEAAKEYYERALEQARDLTTHVGEEVDAYEARNQAMEFAQQITEELTELAEQAAKKQIEGADQAKEKYTKLQETLKGIGTELDKVSQQVVSVSIDQEKLQEEVAKAKEKIYELDGITTESTHIIHVKKVEEKANGGVVNSEIVSGFSSGGMVFRRLFSRYIPGWGNRDDVPALLQRGEYVIRKEAVRKYGLAFVDAINRMKLPIPKFQEGGLVDLVLENIKKTKAWIDAVKVSGGSGVLWNMKKNVELLEALKKLLKLLKSGLKIDENDLKILLKQLYIRAQASLIGNLRAGSKAQSIIDDIRKKYHLPTFATGGLVDTIPALLSPGEYVLKRDAVRYYGLGFINALNRLQVPKFATGGFVGAAPSGSTYNNMITLNINITGTQQQNLNDRMFWERIFREQILPQIEDLNRRMS